MRSATVCTYLMALATLSHAAARTVHFVADGAGKDIREAGQPWTRGKGYLESSGVGNVLRAGHRLGAGDFVVRARLSLARLERTAASFMLGNVHFGFDGHPAGRLFIEGGPFGKAQLLADATEFLAPGEPFLLEVRREGGTLSFAINGKLAHRAAFRKSAIPSMGLRPHRGTMRVYEFSATGKLTPLRSNEMGDVSDMVQAETIEIAGLPLHTAAPPEGLVLREELGLVTSRFVNGQVVHRTPHPGVGLFEVKGTITPSGDYLLMFPEGQHYGGKWKKVNTLLAYRSSDKGKTWTGPTAAYDIPYSQHGFIPLIPRGTKRLYCFGTQPLLEKAKFDGRENATIGFRHSDDDGRTWSDVTLIRPVNDPGFLGMSVMRMCETDAGTWLVGSHEADWTKKPLMTRQYILRSEDKGKTWTVLPGKRPGGWFEKQHNRMDELRPIPLGGGTVLALART
ncbi:exo-alpha-sialidase, partial [bacterium]|nr:exo-alpha-sialidase [bacterium]